jgi:hypothetical protein
MESLKPRQSMWLALGHQLLSGRITLSCLHEALSRLAYLVSSLQSPYIKEFRGFVHAVPSVWNALPTTLDVIT